MRRNRVQYLTAILLALLWSPGLRAQDQAGNGVMVFLVRHAERADDGADIPHQADPSLSSEGRERAALLARLLRDAGITQVYSTDYVRTRETASPTASGAGVEISIYDANQLDVFAGRLLSEPGRHLVVGHSNTTWDLVQALGGDPGDPIEALEYDRLYILTFESEGVRTVLLRFGNPGQQ
jgi:phosphohistidine phosphatase SixA